MVNNEYTELDTEQLLAEKAKMKLKKLAIGLVIIGAFICFVIMAVKNGMSFFTFLPLAVAFLAMKSIEKMHALEAVLNSKGLE